MKVSQPGAGKRPKTGSFGLPPHMKAKLNEQREAKREAPQDTEQPGDTPPQAVDFMTNEPIEEGGKSKKGAKKKSRSASAVEGDNEAHPSRLEDSIEKEIIDKNSKLNPHELLAEIGVEFTDEDFQRLVFKGSITKNIVITHVAGKDLVAEMKTLTTKEYQEVDELLMTEAGFTRMTDDSFKARQSMWTIAYGVAKLMDKPLSRPINKKDTDEPDTKARAQEIRKVFEAMAPGVVNLIVQKHGILTVAVNMIVASPGTFSKNS